MKLCFSLENVQNCAHSAENLINPWLAGMVDPMGRWATIKTSAQHQIYLLSNI
jgi:hypothetical protein